MNGMIGNGFTSTLEFLIPNRDHGAIIQVVEMAVAVEFFIFRHEESIRADPWRNDPIGSINL
jgi:hypothetical protein